MIKAEQKADNFSLTSTQIGAIGEAIVAAELTLASGGRLAPFKPFADDDGIDLLIYDKVTKRALKIGQVELEDASAEDHTATAAEAEPAPKLVSGGHG